MAQGPAAGHRHNSGLQKANTAAVMKDAKPLAQDPHSSTIRQTHKIFFSGMVPIIPQTKNIKCESKAPYRNQVMKKH